MSLSSILSAIWDFIKDNLLEIIIAIIIIVAIYVFFPAAFELISGFVLDAATAVADVFVGAAEGLLNIFIESPLAGLAITAAGAVVLFPDESAEFIDSVAGSAADLVSSVISATTTSVIDTLLSSKVVWVAGAALLGIFAVDTLSKNKGSAQIASSADEVDTSDTYLLE